jgi:hypothetical protein
VSGGGQIIACSLEAEIRTVVRNPHAAGSRFDRLPYNVRDGRDTIGVPALLDCADAKVVPAGAGIPADPPAVIHRDDVFPSRLRGLIDHRLRIDASDALPSRADASGVRVN